MQHEAFVFATPPPSTWKIVIGEGPAILTIELPGKIPNRFNRFMYKLLLGWKVEKI